MMNEVVAGRLYKETDLRSLFKTYLHRAPIHDKPVRALERLAAFNC
jgi:hypothetical protein